jgi:hypothetical protein
MDNNEEGGSLAALVVVVVLIMAALSDNAGEYFVGLCGIAMALAGILCVCAPIVFCFSAFKKLFGGK